jgi:hypothetical protein
MLSLQGLSYCLGHGEMHNQMMMLSIRSERGSRC